MNLFHMETSFPDHFMNNFVTISQQLFIIKAESMLLAFFHMFDFFQIFIALGNIQNSH